VIQNNESFGRGDRLEVHLDQVRMLAGNGKMAEKTKGRSLDVMSTIKKSILTVKTALNCLACAFIIAMARVNSDPKYKSYSNGRGLKKPVEDLPKRSGMDMSNGGSFEELRQFKDQLTDYQIIVFDGLNTDMVMLSGYLLSAKELHLLYNRDNEHYNVITNLKGAMAKEYICSGCIHYTALRTNVTKLAPCVLLHHPVLRVRPNIVAHATYWFSVRNVFRII